MGRADGGGTGDGADEVEEFAGSLRALKERSGRSYGALATRLNVSTSTLHRYCNGDAVPMDYAPVERLARLCGATPDELLALHRRWLLADARRAGAGAGAGAGAASGAAAAGRGRLRSVPDDVPSGGEGRAAWRPAWPTRPWALVAGAAAVVVLAVTAVEVRSSSGGGGGGGPRNHSAVSPPAATATPKAPATRPPTAGPTARGRLERKESGEGTTRSGAPHSGKGGGAASTPTAASRPPRNARLPLTLGTRSHVWENGCDHRYLIDRPPADVAPPPTEQDAPAWAAAHDAVHGGTTNVEVTVQGRADSAVVLQALHVRVVGRRTPLAWSSYAMDNGCGGALTPRAFSVDLDAARPQVHPTDGNDEGKPIPAVRFPYRVSASDPEVLLVNARTAGCDCRWYLELEWTSGDRSGTARIDDGGTPFRTSGVPGRPAYGYDYAEGAWRGTS
ncbi:helix-turn-helix domain-containing protein [Streptomyces sp. NPDC059850]|uniref:helix-turn-helix domain-containing protein n=1 Tax=Streptomyces sp. NPDC059850 TaxID=3346970 RepID=UPI00366763E6